MNLQVTPEQMKTLETGAKSILESTVSGTNQLTAEAINLFIVQSAMHVLKFASVFILFYMVKRYLEFLKSAGMSESKIKAANLTALIISLTFFTTQSFPHLLSMTEAVVAPHIFLLKKGAEFYKEVK